MCLFYLNKKESKSGRHEKCLSNKEYEHNRF